MSEPTDKEWKPVVLEMSFNQDQIVAILGMFVAQSHGMNPRDFAARFELKTDFKDDASGGLSFAAKITLTELEELLP